MKERRAFGPPGCGKTTWLKGQVARFAQQFGATNVLCLSHTRTAARELANRDLDVPSRNVATLHALCYRALGQPRIAEEHLDAFRKAQPHWAHAIAKLTGPLKLGGSPAYLETASNLRNRLIPAEKWADHVRHFFWVWDAWMNADDYCDYTRLVERCLEEVAEAPGSPAVLLVDEAQDLTPLQLALVRKWGERAQYLILVGDDDQCIFSFSGATPGAFLDPPLPDEHKVFLRHSYRLPRKVHALAESWVATLSRREEKHYTPRDEEGEVVPCGATWRAPRKLLAKLRDVTDSGKTCMVLASCEYMLQPTLTLLREEIIPFHNPYVDDRPGWNPLAHGGPQRRAVDQLLAFLRPSPWVHGQAGCWSGADLWCWAERTKGLWKRGFKKWAEERKDSPEEVTPTDLWEWLDGAHRADADRVLLDLGTSQGHALSAVRWWLLFLGEEDRKLLDFPLKVLARYGPEILRATPQVTVGTVHSVKGGEADWVFLFPDLSTAAQSAWQRGEKDPEIRTFYVGITRAKEGLALCQSCGPHADLRRHACPVSFPTSLSSTSVAAAGSKLPAATGRTHSPAAATTSARPN